MSIKGRDIISMVNNNVFAISPKYLPCISNFTRKKKLGLDGTPRYTLSIGCTVPKGVRILLKEQASTNGARTFEIIDIRYRKDIYRLNQL